MVVEPLDGKTLAAGSRRNRCSFRDLGRHRYRADRVQQQRTKRADATSAVFLAATTAVVPPPEKPPEPAEGEETPKKDAPKKDEAPSFLSDKDRAAAIVSAAVGEDAKGKPWADLVIGAAKAQTGDYAAQLAAIDVALKQVAGQPLELALRDQRATALAAMGKTADAAAELDKLAKDAPTNFAKANAQLRIGDLYNPALGSKAADAVKAKGAYEAALKAAQVNEKDTPRGAWVMLCSTRAANWRVCDRAVWRKF